KPIRVERQFQVDEVMAAMMEVQTFGGSIGADENDAVPRAEQFGYLAALSFVVLAAHGEDLLQLRLLQSIDGGPLAVDVLRVNENVGIRLVFANVLNSRDQAVELGVVFHGVLGQFNKVVEVSDDIRHLGLVAGTLAYLPLHRGKLLSQVFCF